MGGGAGGGEEVGGKAGDGRGRCREGGVVGRMLMVGRRAEGGDALKAGEAGYAVGALGFERGGGGVMGVTPRGGVAGVEVAAVAVLDGGSGQR